MSNKDNEDKIFKDMLEAAGITEAEGKSRIDVTVLFRKILGIHCDFTAKYSSLETVVLGLYSFIEEFELKLQRLGLEDKQLEMLEQDGRAHGRIEYQYQVDAQEKLKAINDQLEDLENISDIFNDMPKDKTEIN